MLMLTLISGSYRAAQYAATYPHRVGNFVLDAVAPYGLVMLLTSLETIKLP